MTMDIWNHACRTDPSATKGASVDGHRQTSISGYWMIQKATELWGPLGHGWGYEIEEERYDIAGPIFRQKGDEEIKIADETIHTIKLRLWYMVGEKKCSLVQFGHTPYIYRSKYGFSSDKEAPKKSLTDAIKKSLSMLGFCADVFLGQFDDINYVNAVGTEFAIEKADQADAVLEQKQKEFIEWAKAELNTYALIPNKASLKAMLAGHWKKISMQAPAVNMNPNDVFARFQKAHDAALEAIQSKGAANNV